MSLESTIRENLIITAFLIVIIDRLLVLAAIKVKAQRILIKVGNTWTFERHVLNHFVDDFNTIVMSLGLLCFAALCLMQTFRPETFSDDMGRVVFALLGFMLSVSGTVLNMCIERIDLKKAQEALA